MQNSKDKTTVEVIDATSLHQTSCREYAELVKREVAKVLAIASKKAHEGRSSCVWRVKYDHIVNEVIGVLVEKGFAVTRVSPYSPVTDIIISWEK